MRVWKPVAAVAALACLLLAVFVLGRAFVQPKPSAQEPTPVTERAGTASRTASPAADYVGYWCDSANAPRRVMSRERMDELEVVGFDGNRLLFTVMHTGAAPSYRITSSENTVVAEVVDRVARVEFDDDRGGMNRATIQLLGDRILVRIVPVLAADNGSLGMDAVMLRDRLHGTRTVDESMPSNASMGAEAAYHTPSPGSAERGALMDAARETFLDAPKTKFVVHELYVQGDWAVGTLDPVGFEHGPPYENVYVWRKANGVWTCLQGCGDVGDLTLDDVRDAVRQIGVPANLVDAIRFK